MKCDGNKFSGFIGRFSFKWFFCVLGFFCIVFVLPSQLFVLNIDAELVNVFVAVGTLGAVIVALFQNPFLKWWNRADLCVSIKNIEPYCQSVPQFIRKKLFWGGVEKVSNGNAIYLRLKVENIGSTTATNVAVYAKKLIGKNASRKIDWNPAMNLSWSNEGKERRLFYPHISPGVEKYCDVGFICDPAFRKSDSRYNGAVVQDGKYNIDEPACYLSVAYPLGDYEHIIGPGEYQLDLIVSSDNAKRVEKSICFEFKEWKDDPTMIDVYLVS
ncbi:MAG: hypothetical protein C1941_02795 [Prosthecochloris sp.]|nr:hypothetical protein [Prosthecochloris sp.]